MRAWPQLRQWQSTPDLAFTVTHPSHLLTWIVAALNRLGPDRAADDYSRFIRAAVSTTAVR